MAGHPRRLGRPVTGGALFLLLALSAASSGPPGRPVERVLLRVPRPLVAAARVLFVDLEQALSAEGCSARAGRQELVAACPVAAAGDWSPQPGRVLVDPLPGGGVRRVWPAPGGPLGVDPLAVAYRLTARLGPMPPARRSDKVRLVITVPERPAAGGRPLRSDPAHARVYWLPAAGGTARLEVIEPYRPALAALGGAFLAGAALLPGRRRLPAGADEPNGRDRRRRGPPVGRRGRRP
jgi:hypothetical protein